MKRVIRKDDSYVDIDQVSQTKFYLIEESNRYYFVKYDTSYSYYYAINWFSYQRLDSDTYLTGLLEKQLEEGREIFEFDTLKDVFDFLNKVEHRP